MEIIGDEVREIKGTLQYSPLFSSFAFSAHCV